MQAKIEDKNGIKICYIEGEINANTSPMLKKKLEDILKNKSRKVVINFCSVSYIDSSGLATLVELLKNVKSFSGELKLTNMQSKIKNLFEITKLEKLFNILETEEDAIKLFA